MAVVEFSPRMESLMLIFKFDYKEYVGAVSTITVRDGFAVNGIAKFYRTL
jgi:hypothetical protein